MGKAFSNSTGIPLSMTVWLADDTYDSVDNPDYLSATEIIQAPRQIILNRRIGATAPEKRDIATRMATALGSAMHNAIEDAWVHRYQENMAKMGYPEGVINRILVNPEPSDIKKDSICVYFEKRAMRRIGKYILGGKFDMVADGQLEDFKSAAVYKYMSGSNDWKFKMQGSIYRWLNPELITGEYIGIDFMFTDWSARDAMIKKDKGYPPARIWQHKIPLLSLLETEAWLLRRAELLEKLEEVPEPELPFCDRLDLWQDMPTFKYYKNPEKRARSTKNFDTLAEAETRLIQDGGVGIVIETPAEAKACKYCNAFDICTQKDLLLAEGTLRL